jgi:hypothetical protein
MLVGGFVLFYALQYPGLDIDRSTRADMIDQFLLAADCVDRNDNRPGHRQQKSDEYFRVAKLNKDMWEMVRSLPDEVLQFVWAHVLRIADNALNWEETQPGNK